MHRVRGHLWPEVRRSSGRFFVGSARRAKKLNPSLAHQGILFRHRVHFEMLSSLARTGGVTTPRVVPEKFLPTDGPFYERTRPQKGARVLFLAAERDNEITSGIDSRCRGLLLAAKSDDQVSPYGIFSRAIFNRNSFAKRGRSFDENIFKFSTGCGSPKIHRG